MAGEIQRRVRIVYEVEGVEDAAEAQAAFGDAAEEAGRKLASQGDVARESEQVYQRQQQALSDLTGAMGGIASMLGSESELGSVIGRMAQGGQVGRQLGAALGALPGPIGQMAGTLGALGGTIVGTAVPAISALFDALTPVVPAIREVTDESQRSAQAAIEMGDAFAGAGDRMRDFLDSVSTAGRARALADTNAQITELADRIEQIGRSGSAMERLDLPGLRDRLAGMMAESEGERQQLEGEGAFGGGRRRGGGRGRRESAWSKLEELMGRAGGGNDAIGFAAGLDPVDVSGRPSDFDVQVAGRQRPGGPGSGLRAAAAEREQMQALERLRDKQKEAHEEQMARIQQQVDAWTSAGERIGGVIAGAFKTAIQGQEDFGVAVIKGFKSIAVEFGGQMIAEGVGALFTAIGNTILNPPAAATKAAEGAGKIALGVGLGAAGAAIPVPSAGSAQAKPPRLGPASSGEGGGASVVYNLNAPAVVTGTRAELGREMARTIRQSSMRFGRAA